jgi:hypothetical protein
MRQRKGNEAPEEEVRVLIPLSLNFGHPTSRLMV